VFGARTALRASDWSNALSLDYKNIQYSSDDYVGEENVASVLFDEGKLQAAKPYAEASTKIYTTGDNYYILGLIDSNQREYSQAEAVFYEGLQHHDTPLATQLLYENTARMMVLVSSPSTAKQFIVKALDIYQQDAQLWFFLALIDYKTGDAADAKYTITKAASYSDGQDSTINSAYKIIMSDGSLKLQ
jgi:tetratricopeptide (TPR) repeat protein